MKLNAEGRPYHPTQGHSWRRETLSRPRLVSPKPTREEVERATRKYLASGRRIKRLVDINTIIPNEIATSIEEADSYIDQSWSSEF